MTELNNSARCAHEIPTYACTKCRDIYPAMNEPHRTDCSCDMCSYNRSYCEDHGGTLREKCGCKQPISGGHGPDPVDYDGHPLKVFRIGSRDINFRNPGDPLPAFFENMGVEPDDDDGGGFKLL